jgi:uncharacterized membrane protein (UPF0182 family)
MMRSRRKLLLTALAVVVVLPILLSALPDLVVDWLWFDSVGFLAVHRTRLLVRFGFTMVGFLITFGWLAVNMVAAARVSRRYPRVKRLNQGLTISWRSHVITGGWIAVVLVTLFGGLIVGAQWEIGLRFLNSTAFGIQDPVFQRDIGYYLFEWPFLKLLGGWSLWLVGLALLGAALIHASDQLETGRIQFEPAAISHLTVLAAAFLGVRAWNYSLDRFDVLFSVHGALHGAGYTDLKVTLPAYNTLAILLVVAAVLMLINLRLRKAWPVWVPLALWLIVSLLMINIAPSVVQRVIVTPDELSRERPYIERNIAFTRQAYGINSIQQIPFAGTGTLATPSLENNQDTLANVRLWDWQPLQRTYRQLQEIRTYYEFGDVDVSRYELAGGPRSVMIAARELQTDQLTEQARTWINQHLIYTHGHGVVLNAVNEVTSEGLPQLLVRDIPPRSDYPELEIERPEIYFGEADNDYIVVGGREQELDYPQGDTNVYTQYHGDGGIPLGNVFKRLIFMLRFGDLPLLLSQSVTGESQILMNRSIQDRIETIAPFLWLDADPYIVISEGRLYWVQDAYTYSDQYPYSEPVAPTNGRELVNYVRNSVKIVVDAYDGTTTFYAADPTDPILQTFQKIYPTLFTPYDRMPADLRAHVRYPEDLFSLQAKMYMTYHMRDPQVFYNREDLWQAAIEVRGGQEMTVEPYFVIMRLPGEMESEFMLTLPLTPTGKDNMIAWLYADSDGPDYGQMGVLQLSKQELIYGPRQIEARIDQDPTISQQLSLWNQRGSQVIRGNMMVVPIDDGLLYVEPIFLQAESGRLPELKRIVVAHGSRIAMRETFGAALQAVISGDTGGLVEAPVEPVPAEPSEGIDALVESANQHYLAAQECLQQGDWACYGTEQEGLRQDLEALLELTGQPAAP